MLHGRVGGLGRWVHSCAGGFERLFCRSDTVDARQISICIARPPTISVYDMARLDSTRSVLVGFTLILAACATPPAEVVEKPATEKPAKQVKVPEPDSSLADLPPLDAPDPGIRMPNFLDLPSDGEFRRANPRSVPSSGSGAVISRPPTEPPPRVKPDEAPGN